MIIMSLSLQNGKSPSPLAFLDPTLNSPTYLPHISFTVFKLIPKDHCYIFDFSNSNTVPTISSTNSTSSSVLSAVGHIFVQY